ncbi:hypothetical protein OB2597_18461 [Pseudooceanicola batsensis HTCC2597]|uniref:Uncharacterized protein n=1 Tax=Pseudooceanicola batsensis (strain ATCC BAA-863 / DSM 15984 / KCTC 12145 / HTCC2597) TaxID=252305 RepID=A3U3D7_PSEBH|nr:hypothetical protein OB2597_18461 [Pseudooceanicola batsensis HTCC2597]
MFFSRGRMNMFGTDAQLPQAVKRLFKHVFVTQRVRCSQDSNRASQHTSNRF